jgi:glycosyltransferase involved in cell wall biosynthesis
MRAADLTFRAMPSGEDYTVLHYVGYDVDRGGIISVVRALAHTRKHTSLLGVNPGFAQTRPPGLETLRLPRLVGESIGPVAAVRARRVARAVQNWLHADAARIYHGHSRAGLLVALWLHALGERRVVVSVHCYGRQRWFYRWAARRLGERLFWLSPAMKRHYRVGDGSWSRCIPGCANLPAGTRPGRGWRCDGVLRLGGVGALVPWKRWDLVVAALRQLDPATRARVEFRHLGATDDSKGSLRCAAVLRERAAGLPVTWCGWRDDPSAFYGEIDALVVASAGEPFSVAMLEALAAGIPVLAADSGGAIDVIRPPFNGWLFETGDASALAAVIRNLLEPGAEGTSSIDVGDLQRFAPAVVAAQWSAVYARLVSDGGL